MMPPKRFYGLNYLRKPKDLQSRKIFPFGYLNYLYNLENLAAKIARSWILQSPFINVHFRYYVGSVLCQLFLDWQNVERHKLPWRILAGNEPLVIPNQSLDIDSRYPIMAYGQRWNKYKKERNEREWTGKMQTKVPNCYLHRFQSWDEITYLCIMGQITVCTPIFLRPRYEWFLNGIFLRFNHEDNLAWVVFYELR